MPSATTAPSQEFSIVHFFAMSGDLAALQAEVAALRAQVAALQAAAPVSRPKIATMSAEVVDSNPYSR